MEKKTRVEMKIPRLFPHDYLQRLTIRYNTPFFKLSERNFDLRRIYFHSHIQKPLAGCDGACLSYLATQVSNVQEQHELRNSGLWFSSSSECLRSVASLRLRL